MAHPKHDAVQQRYGGCCGYCGLSETDTGGERTVDHFRPLSAGGDDGDENLVYACFRWNLFKGDFHPNGDDLRNGRRVLHPLLDDVSQLRLGASGERIRDVERRRQKRAAAHRCLEQVRFVPHGLVVPDAADNKDDYFAKIRSLCLTTMPSCFSMSMTS